MRSGDGLVKLYIDSIRLKDTPSLKYKNGRYSRLLNKAHIHDALLLRNTL